MDSKEKSRKKQQYKQHLLSDDQESFDNQQIDSDYGDMYYSGGNSNQKPKQEGRYQSSDDFKFRPRFSTVTSQMTEKSKISKGFKNKRPLQEASFCQKLCFTWIIPVLKIANLDKKLSPQILGELRPQDLTLTQTKRIQAEWNKRKNLKGKNRLCTAICRTYLKEYTIAALLSIFGAILEMLSPLVLYYLLHFLEDKSRTDHSTGYLLVTALIAIQFISFVLAEHSQVFQGFLGRKTTMGLVGLIGEKILRVSPACEKVYTQGQIVNLVQVDAQKLAILSQNFALTFRLPVLLSVSVIMLFYLIGASFLAGIGVMVFTVFYNLFLSKWNFSIQKKVLKASDDRMQITTQVFHNIKTIKFNAWTQHFQDKINEKRNKQLEMIHKRLLIMTLNISSFYIFPLLVSMAAFLVYECTGHTLSPSMTYTVIAVFNILKGPLKVLPTMINVYIEAFLSMKRIQDYMMQDEIDPFMIDYYPRDKFNYAVEIQNKSFTWKMPKDDNGESPKQNNPKTKVQDSNKN